MNKYPIYIPTKGRFESRKTVNSLIEMGVNFRVVIEPQEEKQYSTILKEIISKDFIGSIIIKDTRY